MIKESFRTRKSDLKRFELQMAECFLLILLFILSYDLAGRFVYHTFFPLWMINEDLRRIIIVALIVIIISFYKCFNFLEQSLTEVIEKIIVAGFLLNVSFVVSLYFFSSIKLSINYFFVAYVMQIILIVILKTLTTLLGRIIIRQNLSLAIVKDYFSTRDLLIAIRKECQGRLTIVSYDDDNLRKKADNADHIYLTGYVTRDLKNKMISCYALENKKVYVVPEIFDIAIRKSAVTFIGDTPVFTMESFHLSETQRFVKRLFDILLSLLGIALSLPIILFAAIAILHEDNGPVFYVQERAGLKGKPFEVIKFRSMVEDAEKETGAVLATENDCRITKIGGFMRSTRIDEIPQFFNVLKGNMSLVGPRPERPVFVEEFSRKYPEYQCRLAVKPGITGLAQVKGNYTTTPENKIKYDLMYIINYSLLLDLKILFQTVKVVLNREKAKGLSSEAERYDAGNHSW